MMFSAQCFIRRFSYTRLVVCLFLLILCQLGFPWNGPVYWGGEAAINYANIRNYETSSGYRQEQELYCPPPPPPMSDGFIKYLAKKAVQGDLDKLAYGVRKLNKCCAETKANVTRLEDEIKKAVCPKYFLHYFVFWDFALAGPVVRIFDQIGFTLSNQNTFAHPPMSPDIHARFLTDAQLLFPSNIILAPGTDITAFLATLAKGSDALAKAVSVLQAAATGETSMTVTAISNQKLLEVSQAAKDRSLRVAQAIQSTNLPTLSTFNVNIQNTRQKRQAPTPGSPALGIVGFTPQFVTLASQILRTGTESFSLTPTDPTILLYMAFGYQLSVRLWLYECEPVQE